MLGAGKPLPDLARDYVGVDAQGRIADSDLRARIANHVMDARAHTLTMQRAAAEAKGNSNPSAVTSIMKNLLHPHRTGEGRTDPRDHGRPGPGLGRRGLRRRRARRPCGGWLSGKAWTIFGGSAEIQNNIISKRILGLPDATKST